MKKICLLGLIFITSFHSHCSGKLSFRLTWIIVKVLAVVNNNIKFHLKYIVLFSDKTEESSTVYNESQPVQITSPGRYWINNY